MVILENIKVIKESRSFIDCLYGVLTAAGLFSGPKYMLSGMTGMSFRFVIHERMLPSSLDKYNWSYENWRHVNSLGIYSEVYEGRINNPAFILYQKAAISKIKASIDSGIGAIAWGMTDSQFGVILGYDDQDQVFYFKNPGDTEERVILYANFGVIAEGNWYYQIFGESIDKDLRDIYRDSLQIAVDEWESPYKQNTEYGSGRKAYEYLVNALRKGTLNNSGAYYVLPVYVNSKLDIYKYLAQVELELPEISRALGKYMELSTLYQNIINMPFTYEPEEDRKFIPQLIEIFSHAKEIEEAGIHELKLYLRETLNNIHVNPDRLMDL